MNSQIQIQIKVMIPRRKLGSMRYVKKKLTLSTKSNLLKQNKYKIEQKKKLNYMKPMKKGGVVKMKDQEKEPKKSKLKWIEYWIYLKKIDLL